MRETHAAKTVRLLATGAVIVTEAHPGIVTASVRGDGAVHHVTYREGRWACTCQHARYQPDRDATCTHAAATRRCTAPDLGDHR